jgi:hypothetical protein
MPERRTSNVSNPGLLFCLERRCFIVRCILGFGAVNRRDVSGRCVLLLLWSVMLKLAEDIGYLTKHGNVTCSDFLIPFEIHAIVYFPLPISCDFIAAQEEIP